jgi:hypothetical protein
MSRTTIRHPSVNNFRAIAAPMPRPAPVINATSLLNLMMNILLIADNVVFCETKNRKIQHFLFQAVLPAAILYAMELEMPPGFAGQGASPSL